jgi:hypothetical protein
MIVWTIIYEPISHFEVYAEILASFPGTPIFFNARERIRKVRDTWG